MRWTISHQTARIADDAVRIVQLRDVAEDEDVNLAVCHVVDSPIVASRLFLPVDVDDWYAYDCRQDYALVVHGTQPARK